jgi:hypothetical protein
MLLSVARILASKEYMRVNNELESIKKETIVG